jgi:hypothetical protein
MAWEVRQRRINGAWRAELFDGDKLVESHGDLTRSLTRREREAWMFARKERKRREAPSTAAWDEAMVAAAWAAWKDFDVTKATVDQEEQVLVALGRRVRTVRR